MSSRIQPHDVVGATHCLELKVGARKSAGAETVMGRLDFARKEKNPRNLVRATP